MLNKIINFFKKVGNGKLGIFFENEIERLLISEKEYYKTTLFWNQTLREQRIELIESYLDIPHEIANVYGDAFGEDLTLWDRSTDWLEALVYKKIINPLNNFFKYIELKVIPVILLKYNTWKKKKYFIYRIHKRKLRKQIFKYLALNWKKEINFLIFILDYIDAKLLKFFVLILENKKIYYFNNKFIKFIIKLKDLFVKLSEEKTLELVQEEKRLVQEEEMTIKLFFKSMHRDQFWIFFLLMTLYALIYIIYLLWFGYQFFYDASYGLLEFANQRISYTLVARKTLSENIKHLGSYLTATYSPDSYYNAFYDKENKFKATQLFYDKSNLYPVQAYKGFMSFDQGPSTLQWGALPHWDRGGGLKTFNYSFCFMEKVLVDYYLKRLNSIYFDENFYNYKFKIKRQFIRPFDILQGKRKERFSNYNKYDRFVIRNWVLNKTWYLRDPRWRYHIYYLYGKHISYNGWLFSHNNIKVKDFDSIPLYWLTNSWKYTRIKNGVPDVRDIHYTYFDSYATNLAKNEKFTYWFLKKNPEIALMLYYRNDYYSIFLNSYMSCAIKNFFVFEHILTYLLSGLSDATYYEALLKRYTVSGLKLNTYYYNSESTFKFKRSKRYTYWKYFNNYSNLTKWHNNVHKKIKYVGENPPIHVANLLYPVYHGETDTSRRSIVNYSINFAENKNFFYRNIRLLYYYYKELNRGFFYFALGIYFFYIFFISTRIINYKIKKLNMFKLTGIEELDHFNYANTWIFGYWFTYLILFFFLTFYFIFDFYTYKYNFNSTYYPLLDVIKEFQNLNDLYCEFNDYAYGEDFFSLAMSPEFSNYSKATYKFLKDPYLMEDVDMFENSFRRRDVAQIYEFYMNDSFYFLRLCTSNLYEDSVFYRKWWYQKFSEIFFNFYNENTINDFVFTFSNWFFDKNDQKHKKIKKYILGVRKDYWQKSDFYTIISNKLEFKKYFFETYMKFFFNIDKTYENLFRLDLHDYRRPLKKKVFYKNGNDRFVTNHTYRWLEYRLETTTLSEIDKEILYDYSGLKKFVKFFFWPYTKDKRLFLHKFFFWDIDKKQELFWWEFFKNKTAKIFKEIDLAKKEWHGWLTKNTIVYRYVYKYSSSSEDFYNYYLSHNLYPKDNNYFLNWNNEKTLNDFDTATKFCNIINPFSCSTPKFFPHLYTINKTSNSLSYAFSTGGHHKHYPRKRKIFKLLNTLCFGWVPSRYIIWDWKILRFRREWLIDYYIGKSWWPIGNYFKNVGRLKVDKHVLSKNVFNYNFTIMNRLTKSLLYLEVVSQLENINIENFQNFKFDHQIIRNGVQIKYVFKKAPEWVYGDWDARTLRLDNAIANFIYYYIKDNKYSNLNRANSLIYNIKLFREEQWKNGEIPAPPNHLKSEALWYRLNISSYKKGLGISELNPFWLTYSGLTDVCTFKEYANKTISRPPYFFNCAPLVYFLRHSKVLMPYTFNPKKDILNSELDFGFYQSYYTRFDFFTYYWNNYFDSYKEKYRIPLDLVSAENNNKFLPINPLFDSKTYDYFKSDIYRTHNLTNSINFNFFQFIFGTYFGDFIELILNNTDKNIKDFETNVNFHETINNPFKTMQYTFLSEKTDFYSIYPIWYFGFFSFDLLGSDDCDWQDIKTDNLDFFKIHEISPSWSKLKLNINDIKNFHCMHINLSWFFLINLTYDNYGYLFYILYKTSFIILIFVSILFCLTKIIVISIYNYKYLKNSKKRFYKFGEYLEKSGILNIFRTYKYIYWVYWFFIFFIFFIFFFKEELLFLLI